ncbi:peptidase M24, structural domain-containing protein [Obelidium mucronatum]|nr:peptidase M24, structural domain-containing protein [Obelidium mucronatum]
MERILRLGSRYVLPHLWRNARISPTTALSSRGFFGAAKATTSIPSLGSLGQPASHTHPHLIAPGDVTPGISSIEYELRRAKFADSLPEGSIAIVAGFTLRYATGGIFHEFHQNTDLFYLTGFNEPDGCMILEKDSKKYSKGYQFTLYVRERDPSTEMWDGPRCGLEGAVGYFKADHAEPIHRLPVRLNEIMSTELPYSTSQIITDLPTSPSLPPSPFQSSHAASAPAVPAWTPYATLLGYLNDTPIQKPLNLFKIRKLSGVGSTLPQLRVVKSAAEIAVLRKSGQISGRAHAETMAATKPGVSEAFLHSVMDHSVRKRGSDGMAYVPVVAAGANALTLHYVINRHVAKDGDLILMDAGGEYGGYASDITRTWPVNGKFSEPQRKLYQAVLKTQKACIDKCNERSNVSLDDLQNLAFEVLKVECSKLFGRRLSFSDMNKLYPHHVGHWMGLDVHDVGSVPRTRKLTEGMVITIEPGIYVPNSDSYPEQYRGIGIRIEDDVVIGKDTCTILSAEAPKEIEDIEAVCQGLVSIRE